MTQLDVTEVRRPAGTHAPAASGASAISEQSLPGRYFVATEKMKLFRCGSGQGAREVANPDGKWHAVDPLTGELMCDFGGVVFRWKRYNFTASRTNCSDCLQAIEQARASGL